MTNIGKVKNELIFIAQHSLRPRKNPRESLDYYIESSLSMKPTDRTNQKQPTSIGVTRAAFSSALSLHTQKPIYVLRFSPGFPTYSFLLNFSNSFSLCAATRHRALQDSHGTYALYILMR